MSIPPQAPPRWNHSPDNIKHLVQESITKTKTILDQVATLDSKSCSFDTVIRPIANTEHQRNAEADFLTFYQYVSPQDAVRDASNEAEKTLKEFDVACSMREDVYKSVQAAKDNTANGSLDPESQRLLDKILLEFKRNGMALEPAQRDELKAVKNEMNDLSSQFLTNMNQEKGKMLFTKEELDGIPEDVLNRFERDGDKYIVTHKMPHYLPFQKYVKDPKIRKYAHQEYENRVKQNDPILERLVQLRRQQASILGYPTHVDFATEIKMAKDAKTVDSFLSDLEAKLKTLAKKEVDQLMRLKAQQTKKLGNEFDTTFNVWDWRYLDRLYTEKTLDFDENIVKDYFPADVVVPIILEKYQQLLGCKFVPVKDAIVYHPDVQQLEAWDSDGTFLGYMHLDLYPRDNKFGHAAVWSLIDGCDKPDGSRQYPVAAMVANLPQGTDGKPGLMRHTDVVTFFHEMGHAYHALLSKTKYSRFAGTSVAGDFVEAPSKMLENWCWTDELLSMSSHYETKQPLPRHLFDKLVQSRNINSGLVNLRQLSHARFDYILRTSQEDLDLAKTWCETHKNVSLLNYDNLTYGHGAFGHMAGGYDANYYGYIWANSFSADMFQTVFAKDPMSPEAGKKYRTQILLPGGSRDAMDILKDFLGREPSNNAFLTQLGLTA